MIKSVRFAKGTVFNRAVTSESEERFHKRSLRKLKKTTARKDDGYDKCRSFLESVSEGKGEADIILKLRQAKTCLDEYEETYGDKQGLLDLGQFDTWYRNNDGVLKHGVLAWIAACKRKDLYSESQSTEIVDLGPEAAREESKPIVDLDPEAAREESKSTTAAEENKTTDSSSNVWENISSGGSSGTSCVWQGLEDGFEGVEETKPPATVKDNKPTSSSGVGEISPISSKPGSVVSHLEVDEVFVGGLADILGFVNDENIPPSVDNETLPALVTAIEQKEMTPAHGKETLLAKLRGFKEKDQILLLELAVEKRNNWISFGSGSTAVASTN